MRVHFLAPHVAKYLLFRLEVTRQLIAEEVEVHEGVLARTRRVKQDEIIRQAKYLSMLPIDILDMREELIAPNQEEGRGSFLEAFREASAVTALALGFVQESVGA